MKNKIIAYTGTQGTGKTTSVYEKAQGLKIEFPRLSVGVLPEAPRLCPFPINRDSNHDSQLWIFTKQILNELEACRINDLVVGDRTCFDMIAYTEQTGLMDLTDAMIEMAKAHAPIYREIYFKQCVSNSYVMDDGVRDTDLKYRWDIERILLEIYEECEIPLTFI